MSETKEIFLAWITQDPELQSRVSLDEYRISEYAEVLDESNGVWPFPPVRMVNSLLTDGWHRVEAAKRVGRTTVLAETTYVECDSSCPDAVRDEALRQSCGANATHGLPRSRGDKRRAVELLFNRYPEASNRQIAEWAKVSHTFVGSIRKETMATLPPGDDRTSVTDGMPAAGLASELSAASNDSAASHSSPAANGSEAPPLKGGEPSAPRAPSSADRVATFPLDEGTAPTSGAISGSSAALAPPRRAQADPEDDFLTPVPVKQRSPDAVKPLADEMLKTLGWLNTRFVRLGDLVGKKSEYYSRVRCHLGPLDEIILEWSGRSADEF